LFSRREQGRFPTEAEIVVKLRELQDRASRQDSP